MSGLAQEADVRRANRADIGGPPNTGSHEQRQSSCPVSQHATDDLPHHNPGKRRYFAGAAREPRGCALAAQRRTKSVPGSFSASATGSSATTSPDMPKALVIFDVDGTLIRSMAVDSQCYVSAFLRPSRYRRHEHGLGDISSRHRSRHRRHPLRASSRARAAPVGACRIS